MTARELIQALQKLGEENLDRQVIVFDCASYYTPNKAIVLGKDWHRHKGKILID